MNTRDGWRTWKREQEQHTVITNSTTKQGHSITPRQPCHQEDITRLECKSQVKKIMNQSGVSAFDVILHDGSPNVGGAWAQEATSRKALVVDSVKLATQFCHLRELLSPRFSGHRITVPLCIV